jgi:integrase
MTIKTLLNDFLDQLVGQSPANQRNYQQRLRHLITTHGDQPPQTLTRAAVNDWHRQIIALGYAPATNAGYRQAIRTFAAWLHRHGHIPENTANHLRVGGFSPTRVTLPDEADVAKITAVAHQWQHANHYPTVRRATIWLYAIHAASRLSGLYNLRADEVKHALRDHNGHGLLRLHTTEKGREVVHVLPPHLAPLLAHCLSLRPSTTVPQFLVRSVDPIQRLTIPALQHDLRLIARAADVAPIHIHTLRHRAGDLITRQLSPKAAQAKLNHSDIRTTLRWYHDTSDRDLAEATTALTPAVAQDELAELARLFGV